MSAATAAPGLGSSRRGLVYLGSATVVGLLAGVLWWAVTPLATYTVGADRAAATTERGLAAFFAGDAWFSGIGLVVGVVVGTVGWRWFGRRGWSVVPLVVLAATLAAFGCWGVGLLLGPGGFDERVSAAAPGAVVPIDLTLRAPTTLLVWVVAAVAAVLVGSSLGHDPDDVAYRGVRDDEPSLDPPAGAEDLGAPSPTGSREGRVG